jgi:hypothetical protein
VKYDIALHGFSKTERDKYASLIDSKLGINVSNVPTKLTGKAGSGNSIIVVAKDGSL